MEKEHKFYGYKAAVWAAFYLFVIYGIANCEGPVMPSVIEACNLTSFQMTLMTPVSSLPSAILSAFVGGMISKHGAKPALVLGAVLTALYCIVLTVATGAPLFLISAFIMSIAGAFGHQSGIAGYIGEWFIAKRSSIVGKVYATAGLGGVVCVWVTNQLISKYNYKIALYALAILALVIGLGITFLFLKRPKELGQRPLGAGAAVGEDGVMEGDYGKGFVSTRKTISFWCFMLAILFGALFGPMNTYWVTIMQANGCPPTIAGYINMCYLGIGTVSIFFSGQIIEKVGAKIGSAIYPIGFFVSMLCGYTWVKGGGYESMGIGLIVAAGVVFGLAFPMMGYLAGPLIPRLYGTRDYPEFVSYSMIAMYLGTCTTPIFVGKVTDATGSFATSLLILTCFAALSLIMFLIAAFTAPKLDIPSYK